MEDVFVQRQDGVLTAILDRPNSLNALRRNTLMELRQILQEFSSSSELKVLIVTGRGNEAFTAGGDIRELVDMGVEEARDFARLCHSTLAMIQETPKPIIAAANGIALGAGCDLVLACDFCLASERASFGMPSGKVGIITPFGGTHNLQLVLGPAWAKFLFMTGESIDASTALQIGLVQKVVKHEELMHTAMDTAKKIQRLSPVAIGVGKRLINQNANRCVGPGNEAEIEAYAECFGKNDKKEGMLAFLEKRTPSFKGN